MNGFERFFLPRYLGKHFHSVAVQTGDLTAEACTANGAVVLYVNHASWWDPPVGIFVHRRMWPKHRFYAPIDAVALGQYRIFSRMGFFGIQPHSQRGAAEFLQRSRTILRQSASTLALTPEGKFCDIRDRDSPLQPGLAHLATMIEATASEATIATRRHVWFVPMAIEYTFWEERLPECLVRFGSPIQARWGQTTMDKSGWDRELTLRLRNAQQSLATASIARDPSQFQSLMRGGAGTWRMYDAARTWAARLRGQRLSLEHSEERSRFTGKP